MTKPTLTSVDQALSLIKAKAAPLPSEMISIANAYGRVLAADIIASFDHPPFAASAMDGYAVRFADLENGITQFEVIGTSSAGKRFTGTLQSAQTLRIFTGGGGPKRSRSCHYSRTCNPAGVMRLILTNPNPWLEISDVRGLILQPAKPC